MIFIIVFSYFYFSSSGVQSVNKRALQQVVLISSILALYVASGDSLSGNFNINIPIFLLSSPLLSVLKVGDSSYSMFDCLSILYSIFFIMDFLWKSPFQPNVSITLSIYCKSSVLPVFFGMIFTSCHPAVVYKIWRIAFYEHQLPWELTPPPSTSI